MARTTEPTCPRTGLPTSRCECTSLVPDLDKPLTDRQRRHMIHVAADRDRHFEDELAAMRKYESEHPSL